MGLLLWLEESGLAEWVRSSAMGYPLMIASHAVGMGVMVGIALLVDLRLLGAFRGLRYAALEPFFTIAWVGFGLNFLSGVGLFLAQATSYATDAVFLTKIALVLAGAITAALLQTAVTRDAAGWAAAVPSGVRAVAGLSAAFWTVAIVTGRLIAYL